MKKYMLIIIFIIFIIALALIAEYFYIQNSYTKLTYKIYDNYNQGNYDYSKRGYYINSLKQPNSPYYYIITMGEQNSGGYSISIKDVKIDNNKNVEVVVEETKPNGIVTMELTYPACCLELSSCPNNIIIKNTEGDLFKEINEKWKKINLENYKFYDDCNIKIDLDGDKQKENIDIKSTGKFIIINGKEYVVNKKANENYNVNQYHICDLNGDNIMEIIHRTFSDMISPITSYYTIYNLYNNKLNQVGEMSFVGSLPNEIYVKDNSFKFEYWPFEAPKNYKKEVVLDLQLNYLSTNN